MSTLKKVISLVLCLSLLAGSFAFAGDLIMPKAAAEETTEVVLGSKTLKTYAELADKYDKFIYIGVDVYELTTDDKGETVATLTDGKVKAGQWLEYRETILSDLWIGNINTFYLYDNRFFDITRTSTVAGDSELSANGYETGVTSVYSDTEAHTFNASHPMVVEKVPTVGYTSSPCSSQSYFQNGYTLIDESVYTNLDQAGQVVTYSATATTTALNMTKDAWYLKWYAKVLDEPTVTEATSYSPYSLYKISPMNGTSTSMGDSRVPGNIASSTVNDGGAAPARTTCKNMNVAAQFKSITFLCEDSYTNFVLEGATVEYTAKFVVNGETVEGSEAKYEEGADITVPADPAPEAGYAFKGWSTDGTADGIVTEFVMGKADVTYTAVFEALPKYTATFYVDGAEHDSVETYVGGAINKPADPEAEAGKTFVGWADAEGATASNVTFPVAMPEGGASYYAVFTELATHKVTYKLNGEVYSESNVVEELTYDIIAAPTLDKYTKFIGWSTIEDDETAIVTGTQTMGTADVVYYAITERVIFHTVTYYVDGVAQGEGVEYEENVGTYIVKEDAPAKTGYTFKGWSTAEDSIANIVTGEQTMGTADVALYAVYEVNTYKVTFNANKGAFADGKTTAEAQVAYNAAITAPEAEPAREGYAFKGWAKTSNATAALEDLGTMGTSAVTLYAVWSVNTYTATFYLDKDSYDNNGAVVETKSIAYGSNLVYDKLSALEAQKDGCYFDCWVDAETGKDVPKSGSSANIKYNFASDKAFYAKWTEYPNSIVLMVRDYENGEGWTELKTFYSKNTTDKIYESAIKGMDIDAVMGWENINVEVPATWPAPIFSTAPDAEATLSELKFAEGRQVYYLYKSLASFELTWKLPEFDADGYITDSFKEETVTVSATHSSADPFADNNVLVPDSIDTTAPAGYVFDGWYDDAGNKVAFAQGKTTLAIAGGNRTLTANYSLVDYRIVFNVNNAASSSVIKVLDTTYNLGDEVSVAGGKFVDADGNATVLPTIGKENGEQTGGDREEGKAYYNANGYKFAGWELGLGANKVAFDIESDTIELTAENIAKYIKTGTNDIILYGVWEAQSYDAVFYYATGFDADGNATYAELARYTLKTGERLLDAKKAATVLVNEKLPEGKTFNAWTNSGVTSMPAGGIEFKPVYVNAALKVYLNYNNGTEDNPLTLEETMKDNSFYALHYGMDIMALEEGELNSLYDSIRKMTITNTPGESYICIGWDIYAVEEGKDPYDKANWIDVDENAEKYIATTDLIFQANWKASGDFLIRIYDTNHKIIKALGKDLKMYYWASEIATDRKNGDAMNHLPEGLVIILLIPELEGWDWERFFDCDMWSGLSLKIEPFAVNKTFFDPSNFAQLMKTLFTFVLGEIGIGGSEEEAPIE